MSIFGQVQTGQLWAEWWIFLCVAVFLIGCMLVCWDAVRTAKVARDEALESERRCSILLTQNQQLTTENAVLSKRYEDSRASLVRMIQQAEKLAKGFAGDKAA